MNTMHQTILDHFSLRKYVGNVYTTADRALQWNSPIELDGNVDVLTGKYLKINSSTVTVDGTTTFAALGTVEITSGSVTLTGQDNQWGTFVIRNGGTLLVKSGATLTLEAPLFFVLQTGSHLTLESGATLTIKTNTTVGRGVNLTVPAGATLNIQVPGEIYVDKDGAVDVYGLLSAQGTDEQHVLFSSLSEVPGPGDWYGLAFHTGASGLIENADIHYAQYGAQEPTRDARGRLARPGRPS